MTTDRQAETSLVPAQEQGLSVTPAKDLLFLTVGKSNLPIAQIRTSFLSLINQKPEAVELAIATAYYHPEVINHLEPKLTPTLSYVRENFQRVIGLFSNETIAEVIQLTPLAQQRLNHEKETLELAEESKDIKDIEITLMLMSEYGDASKLTIEDYSRVVAFHDLYTNLVKYLIHSNGRALSTFSEMDRFYKVGQNLLTSRRLYEYEAENADRDYNQTAPTRSADYEGKISQLRIMAIFMGNLRATDPKSPQISHLRESFGVLLGEAQRKHPDRSGELLKLFGTADIGHLSYWAQNPGDATNNALYASEWVGDR